MTISPLNYLAESLHPHALFGHFAYQWASAIKPTIQSGRFDTLEQLKVRDIAENISLQHRTLNETANPRAERIYSEVMAHVVTIIRTPSPSVIERGVKLIDQRLKELDDLLTEDMGYKSSRYR